MAVDPVLFSCQHCGYSDTVASPPSHCPNCGNEISPFDDRADSRSAAANNGIHVLSEPMPRVSDTLTAPGGGTLVSDHLARAEVSTGRLHHTVDMRSRPPPNADPASERAVPAPGGDARGGAAQETAPTADNTLSVRKWRERLAAVWQRPAWRRRLALIALLCLIPRTLGELDPDTPVLGVSATGEITAQEDEPQAAARHEAPLIAGHTTDTEVIAQNFGKGSPVASNTLAQPTVPLGKLAGPLGKLAGSAGLNDRWPPNRADFALSPSLGADNGDNPTVLREEATILSQALETPSPPRCQPGNISLPMVFIVDGSVSMGLHASITPGQEAALDQRIEAGDQGARSEYRAWMAKPGAKRLDVAKKAFIETLSKIEKATNVGVVAFRDCKEISSTGPVSYTERSRLISSVVGLSVRRGGDTPIAGSLEAAAAMLGSAGGHIVLVTDGQETCGRSACATARAMKSRLESLTIDVIDLSGRSDAACLAELTGGRIVVPTALDHLASLDPVLTNLVGRCEPSRRH
ncbi:MAG: VWA domain-containing protein [Alphaproteobacteria bacterium]|nr:VWA domain-containing protein [Alphaproteobacteria bacterium]